MTTVVCEEAKKTRFWKVDGCINCKAYQGFKDGRLQLHEAMSSCLILNCQAFGHTVLKPFIGTHELLKYWKEHPEEHANLHPRLSELLEGRGLDPKELLGSVTMQSLLPNGRQRK